MEILRSWAWGSYNTIFPNKYSLIKLYHIEPNRMYTKNHSTFFLHINFKQGYDFWSCWKGKRVSD